MSDDHVVCREFWIAPEWAYPEGALVPIAGYLIPNERCGLECPVLNEAEVMKFRCRRGHGFYATPRDIVRPSGSQTDHTEPESRSGGEDQ